MQSPIQHVFTRDCSDIQPGYVRFKHLRWSIRFSFHLVMFFGRRPSKVKPNFQLTYSEIVYVMMKTNRKMDKMGPKSQISIINLDIASHRKLRWFRLLCSIIADNRTRDTRRPLVETRDFLLKNPGFSLPGIIMKKSRKIYQNSQHFIEDISI